ncbi:MAG: hypothetical protein C4312_07990 [Thermoflexus sp.]
MREAGISVTLVDTIADLIFAPVDLITGEPASNLTQYTVTLKTDRGDFSGSGRTPEEAEKNAWDRLTEAIGWDPRKV